MAVKEYKTLPQYDTLWTYLGLFIPCPMSAAQHTPDFVVGEWGFSSTICIGAFKVPLGLVMILVAVIF